MRIPLICLALSLVLSVNILSQEYDVIFQRPLKEGDSFTARIKFSADDDQQIVINGAASPASKKTNLDLDLTTKIEEITLDQFGRATEERLTVQSCECREKGQAVSMLKPGDVVHIKEGKPKEYLINGTPASGLPATALREVFPPHTAQYTSDDKVLGPGKKVKVGDTWPINGEHAVAELSKLVGMEFPKDSVKGSVTLKGVGTKDGIPFLQISGNVLIDAPGLVLPNVPPGIETKKFECTVKLEADLPADTQKPRLRNLMELQMDIESGGTLSANGKANDVSFHMIKKQRKETSIISSP